MMAGLKTLRVEGDGSEKTYVRLGITDGSHTYLDAGCQYRVVPAVVWPPLTKVCFVRRGGYPTNFAFAQTG